MAEAAVHYVLGKIAETAYKEALFLYGVGDEVEWAKRELEWVSAFVKDADAKQNKGALVKKWVEEVKEVAYMIEDALDEFFVKMGGARSKGVLKRVSHGPKALIERLKLGAAIDKIKERLNEIKENRENYGITSLPSSSRGPARQFVRPVFTPEIDETEVVGFEDDIKNICEQLCDESVSRRSVISIVGPGGRGKTTVASKIHKSFREKSHFDCCIWVTVSQGFNVIDIMKKILEKLHKTAKEVGDEEYFIPEVYASLRQKKYLIVLDDVWSSNDWTLLERAFPEDHNGSRLLITTRSKDVAKKSDGANKPYELRTLNEDESQQLLLKKTFPSQFASKCPDNILPVINQFSEKCYGWPLALVVLGGILSMKDPVHWDGLLSKVDWKECLDIISTSYEDLPFALKLCFMYLAVFPEDYQIKASNLIQLWIAEGLIFHDDQSTKTMEDIAESYLEEIAQRCMIQVSTRSWSGRIKYCYIHDILRELAIRKAKENNFLFLCSESDADSISRTSTSTRRIAFYNYNDRNLIELVGGSLRSLIIFGKYLVRSKSNHELTMIRVLNIDVRTEELYQNFKWLDQLIALRYFQCTGNFGPLPISFWNNKMLRHVKMLSNNPLFPSVLMGPPSSANLENLLTLKGVVTSDEWGVKLPHFPCIRKLGIIIEGKIDGEALVNSMSKLEHLYSLHVAGYIKRKYYFILDLRNYKKLHSLYLSLSVCELGIGFNLLPPNLVKLTLDSSHLEEDPMPELEKLSNLRVLRLLEWSYEGERLVFSKGGFKCLQQLKLVGLRNLVELKIEKGGMPNLNQLEISHCPEVNVVPDFQYLTNLRELNLQYMSNDFWSSLEGVNQHKILHLPSKIFNWKLPSGRSFFPRFQQYRRFYRKNKALESVVVT
ncbi:Disease resistance family protein [Rhynchospora pubera]|uniref:Disease resistance family protein n=1 Tax=Rhynchospora pubera TaxID=906938 RepID=A0AAV8GVR4_9POAL|nr:Disease resistance family protein [Rhynchospora pubera]